MFWLVCLVCLRLLGIRFDIYVAVRSENLSVFYRPNTILRLRFNHFATECSWDHLYVYDGDSIYAPLLAAFR